MFGNDVEVKMLEGTISKYQQDIFKLQQNLENAQKEKDLAVELAKNEIRKEMQEKLITSDVTRERAVAKLEAYEKIDPKDEFASIKRMLEENVKAMPKMVSDMMTALVSNKGDKVTILK